MNQTGEDAVVARRRSAVAVGVVAIGFLVALAVARPAMAQRYTSGNPSVSVDTSVLDDLGPPASLPRLLLPGVRSAARPPTKLNFPTGSQRPRLGSPSRSQRLLAPPTRRSEAPPRKMASAPVTLKPPATPKAATTPKAQPRNEPASPADRPLAVAQPQDTSEATAEAPPPDPRHEPPAPAHTATAEAPPARVLAPPPPPPATAKRAELPALNLPPMPEPARPQQQAAPAPIKAEPPAPVKVEPPAPVKAEPRVADLPPVPEPARPQQQAARPAPNAAAPASVNSHGDRLTIAFAQGATALPDNAKGELKGVVDRMSRSADTRIQVIAYAAGDDATFSVARRTSLARALDVRSYLLDQGISNSRIEVRAMGNKYGEGPADRVDIVVTQR